MFIFPFGALGENGDKVPRLDPVTAEAERLKTKPKQTLSGEWLNTTGSGGDPLRGINMLPSVGVLNDFLGVLSVRGGGPEDNLFYFDRLPLGYPYHLLGIISTVNAEVIETVEVYPGGYGAEFGADSQAIIDIQSRTKSDTRLGGNLNFNPVYSQAFLEGNLGKRGYWYAFGRQSYLSPLFELLPRLLKIEDELVRQIPSFWSYQGKGVYQLSETHRLVINAIAADDSAELRLSPKETHDSDLQGPLRSDNPFDAQGIHLYSEKQDKFTSIVSLTRSFSRNALDFGDGYYYQSSQSVYALRGDLDYWVQHPNTAVESGFILSSLPSTLISVGARPPEEGDPDYNFRLKRDGEKVQTGTSKNLHRLEGYLQATQHVASFLYATVGMRAAYMNLIDTFSLQPRGLLGLTLGPGLANPVKLRFMYGSYVQSPQLYQVVLGKENLEIAPSLARHYVIALERELTSDMKVEIAGYYKSLRDMITYNVSESRYQNQRTGSVNGIEVSLEHKIAEKFRGWFAYAYTVSKRRDSPRDAERFYMYNAPHVVTIDVNYMASSWELGAKWQYKSGVLYSPLVDRELYTNPFTKNQTWLPVHGEPRRTAPYHRLDLRFHWSFLQVGRWKGGFTAELWNAYNRNNFLQVRYNQNVTAEVPIAQLPIVPFLAVTLEF